jgi:hypothetical protein
MESIFDGWSQWWSTVPPEFAFLLALPFVIAALCLVADRLRGSHERQADRGRAPEHRRLARRTARLHH